MLHLVQMAKVNRRWLVVRTDTGRVGSIAGFDSKHDCLHVASIPAGNKCLLSTAHPQEASAPVADHAREPYYLTRRMRGEPIAELHSLGDCMHTAMNLVRKVHLVCILQLH